jgi:hypothetical protein
MFFLTRERATTEYSYGQGFTTELGIFPTNATASSGSTDEVAEQARSAIQVKEVRFSGSLKYTDQGRLYVDYPSDEPRYFGEPSPAIDKAWQNLIGRKEANRNTPFRRRVQADFEQAHLQIVINDDEASQFEQVPYKHPLDGTLIGWVGSQDLTIVRLWCADKYNQA